VGRGAKIGKPTKNDFEDSLSLRQTSLCFVCRSEQPGRTVRILRAPWHTQPSLGDISDQLTARRSPAFESEELSYRRSSRPSSSSEIPDTVPVSCPVSVKKTGLLKALAKTGCAVSVNVRTPDAFRKRPVPPLI
jgi:hypothetical protein